MATMANPTRDDFAAMLDDMFGGADSFEGRVVLGTVTGIENDLAVIDVRLNSEGRVPPRQLPAYRHPPENFRGQRGLMRERGTGSADRLASS